MQVEIEIRGVRETMNNIIEFEKDANRQLGLAMAKVVFKITKDAKENAPYKTGHLYRNIIPNVELKRRDAIRGTVTSKAHYSAVVEFGGTNRVPNPFLRRATRSNISFMQNTLGEALRSAMLKVRIK